MNLHKLLDQFTDWVKSKLGNSSNTSPVRVKQTTGVHKFAMILNEEAYGLCQELQEFVQRGSVKIVSLDHAYNGRTYTALIHYIEYIPSWVTKRLSAKLKFFLARKVR